MTTLADIPPLRLISQQISGSAFQTPHELVQWMGALQAQDYAMAKWGLGVRLPAATEVKIETAFNEGSFLRTHVLRPTWHIVSPNDLPWMLDLTGAKIKSQLKSSDKNLELTEEIYKKTNAIIEKSLRDGQHLTREELMNTIEKASISTAGLRSSFMMMRAELDGLVCSGRLKNKKHTYALFNIRIPEIKKRSREEALATLAKKYFQSHSPASIGDFCWWSGLSLTDAKVAVEMNRKNLETVTIGNLQYLVSAGAVHQKTENDSLFLLPAYDEFLISYKDRTASLPAQHNHKAVSVNGIFYPVIIHKGEVIGVWKRKSEKEKIVITTSFFKAPTKALQNAVAKKTEDYNRFTGSRSEVLHTINTAGLNSAHKK